MDLRAGTVQMGHKCPMQMCMSNFQSYGMQHTSVSFPVLHVFCSLLILEFIWLHWYGSIDFFETYKHKVVSFELFGSHARITVDYEMTEKTFSSLFCPCFPKNSIEDASCHFLCKISAPILNSLHRQFGISLLDQVQRKHQQQLEFMKPLLARLKWICMVQFNRGSNCLLAYNTHLRFYCNFFLSSAAHLAICCRYYGKYI